MKLLVLGMTICAASLLGACSSSSDDGDDDVGGIDAVAESEVESEVESNPDGNTEVVTESGAQGSTESIAGLWDVTEIDPDFGEDVFYLRISSDGSVTSIDFQQDEFDEGDNCYIIDNDQTLTPIGGNQYISEIDDGVRDFTQTLTITRSGNILTVSYIDALDEDDDGDEAETLTFNYPLLTGVDPVFNECL